MTWFKSTFVNNGIIVVGSVSPRNSANESLSGAKTVSGSSPLKASVKSANPKATPKVSKSLLFYTWFTRSGKSKTPSILCKVPFDALISAPSVTTLPALLNLTPFDVLK